MKSDVIFFQQLRAVTGKPILYVGMGEKLSDLEQFYPDRMASRILGMGDVLTLIEKAEAQLDADKAKAMEEKLKKAEFDFNDFLEYMGQIRFFSYSSLLHHHRLKHSSSDLTVLASCS